MSAGATARLGLPKPNPGTGELVNVVTQMNAAYDKIDTTAGAAPYTSTTLPSAPYHGQMVRETDTRRVRIWNATQGSWDQFVVSGSTHLAQVEVERAVVADHAYRTKVSGEASQRYVMQVDGRMEWGNGAGGRDTTLYRAGADVLKTDDQFQAVGGVYLANGSHRVLTNWQDRSLASAYPLTTTITDIPGMSWTFTTLRSGALAIVTYSGDFLTGGSSAGTGTMRLNVDAADVASCQAIFNAGNTTAGSRSTSGNQAFITLGGAGSHTIKARGNLVGAGPITLQALHTTMNIQIFE